MIIKHIIDLPVIDLPRATLYPKLHLLIFTFSTMYILVSTFIILCMYLYLMDSTYLLGSFCMGSNAILHPIKLIG